MPARKKEESRILPPEGSKSWPAYKVKLGPGREPIYRFIIQRPGVAPEFVHSPTVKEAEARRRFNDKKLHEHSLLTFEKAIPLYLALVVAVNPTTAEPDGEKPKSLRTVRDRLLMMYGPVAKLPVARFTPELGYLLYMGEAAAKLDEKGLPIILVPGLIHRPTKRPVGKGPGRPRPSRAIGQRYQACMTCGEPGHNKRFHKDGPGLEAPPEEPVYLPPAVDTHHASLRESKKFSAWLVRAGYVPPRNGKHPMEQVLPHGSKNEGGFGQADLTDPELVLLDRTCLGILQSLPSIPERDRLPWHQRAVAVLMCLRCGARTGELLTARRRQFTIIEKSCAELRCEEDHGGHIGGVLQVVREHAKSKTSIRDLPIPPSVMEYVLPLLKGKSFEQFFFSGAPRAEGGGLAGANWERDPNVGLAENWLRDSLEKLCALAGIRTENPHGLRGAYVDKRVASGDPFREISAAVGHEGERVTRRNYANQLVMAEADMRRMMERLGYSYVSGKGAGN
jgi:integrase